MLAAPERSRGKRTRTSRKGKSTRASSAENRELTGDEAILETALRAWRTKEAKKRGVPAFRILTNQTLLGIAVARPKDESELLDVSGIGPALLEKYGRALLSIVARP